MAQFAKPDMYDGVCQQENIKFINLSVKCTSTKALYFNGCNNLAVVTHTCIRKFGYHDFIS